MWSRPIPRPDVYKRQHDDPGGVGVITELILVEAVVLLIGHFALLLLPNGDHAVQGLQLGVGLPLGLVVVGLGVGFGLLTALFALHLRCL